MLCFELQLVTELLIKIYHLLEHTFLEIDVVVLMFGCLDQQFAPAEFLEILVVDFDAKI